MTRKGFVAIFALALGLALAAAPAALAIEIKAATANPPGSFHVVYLEKFKELAEKYSGGKIKVNVYPGGQLGSEEDNVKAVSTGMLQASVMAVNNVTPFAKSVGFMTLPYMFPKVDDAYKLFKSPYMDALNAKMVKEGNFRAIAWLQGGYRVLTNSKHEVKAVDDLKGLKIRVPKNDIMIAVYKAWGVAPVPMAWSEVFNALQQGVIDGQDNPHQVNAAMKFFEVQKYITDIHYLLWTGPMLVNEKWYQGLSKEDRAVVDKAASEAAEYEWKWVTEEDQKAMKLCLEKGMQMTAPADGEKEWMAKAKAVWPNFYASVGGKEVVDEVQKILAGK